MATVIDVIREEGYANVRQLSSGEIIGTLPMAFTTGLFVGLYKTGYKRRYCYEREADAAAACNAWDGNGDPPGLWIKEKPGDRLNPQWAASA